MKVLQVGLFAAALGRTVEDKSVHKDLGNDIRITKETVSSHLFIYTLKGPVIGAFMQ